MVEHQFSWNLFVTSLKSVAIMIFCFALISRLFVNTKFHVVFMHWLWYFVLVCFSLHHAMLRKTFLLMLGSCCVYALVVGFRFALIPYSPCYPKIFRQCEFQCELLSSNNISPFLWVIWNAIISYFICHYSHKYIKKSFSIQELLHHKSKHHRTKPMHPSLLRASQRHQEYDLKHPCLVDLITTKQNKLPSFIDRCCWMSCFTMFLYLVQIYLCFCLWSITFVSFLSLVLS
jgi:hypothetical protein